MNKISLIAAAIALSLSGPLYAADSPADASLDAAKKRLHDAQEQLSKSAREVAELSMQVYGHPDENGMSMPMMSQHRPILGINVEDTDAGHDGAGVKIIGVSPGGPADVGGLKVDDVILSVGGMNVRAGSSKGSPQKRVQAALKEAKSDVPMKVEVQRSGKTISLDVVPKSPRSFLVGDDFGKMPPLPSLPPMGEMFTVSMGGHSSLGSVEFLPLTPAMGHYFGTDKGLLVIKPPKDERLHLKEGDVLLDIDGRTPTNAAHAYRIFSSYRAGESLKLHIMRDQKHVEVPVDIPADASRLGTLRFDRDWDASIKGSALAVKPDDADDDF